MADFQYYSGEEKAQGPKSTQTSQSAPPPNALQFFDDQTAGAQAWSNAVDMVMEAGTVAVDIASKLKEAEHQNQSDEFFLEYTQKVQELRDNINSGKTKSTVHDLQDINGVSDHYRLEEDKLYKDLAQKYNKQNYKRRDSIMRDRKAEPFLNGLSSVRQKKIQEISRKNAKSFNTYMQAQTRELIEAEYKSRINRHALKIGTKKLKAMSARDPNVLTAIADQKELLDVQDQIQSQKDEILERATKEAEKRFRAGTISQEDYDNLEKNVEKTVQTSVAYRLAYEDPQVFLDLHDDPKLQKEAFGFMDPQTYSVYWNSARDSRTAMREKNQKKLSDNAEMLFYQEMFDKGYTQDIDGLEVLREKIRDPKQYKGWKVEDRMSAESRLYSTISSVKSNLAKGEGTTKGVITEAIQSYVTAHLNGQPGDTMPDSPKIVFDLGQTYTNKEELALVEDTIKTYEHLLPKFRRMRMLGSDYVAIEREMQQSKPKKNEKHYYAKLQAWEKVHNAMKDYKARKTSDAPAVIREELNQPEDPALNQLTDPKKITEAIMQKDFNAQVIVNSQIAEKGYKNVGSASSDPNWVLGTKIKVLSNQDVGLFGKLINPKNAREVFPAIEEILKDKYDNWAPVAMRDLMNAGVVKHWYFYAKDLSPDAYQAHIQAEGKEGVPLSKLGINASHDQFKSVHEAGMLRFGSAVETKLARDAIMDGFKRYYGFLASTNPDDPPEPTSVANRYFNGVSIAEMPNHLPSHGQKHIWASDDYLRSRNANAETLSNGAMAMLLKIREKGVEFEGDLMVMGKKDIPASFFVKMHPDNVDKYPGLAKKVKQFKKDLFKSGVVGITSKDEPIFSIVRNPDGQTFALALKTWPHGGIYRIGEMVEGHMKAVTYTLDELIDEGIREQKRSEALVIEGHPGLIASPMDNWADWALWDKGGTIKAEKSTVKQMLQALRNNASERVTLEILDEFEKQMNEKDYQIKGKSGRDFIKEKAKHIRETTPEMLEKNWYESLWDFGAETYYDYLDPWKDTDQVSP